MAIDSFSAIDTVPIAIVDVPPTTLALSPIAMPPSAFPTTLARNPKAMELGELAKTATSGPIATEFWEPVIVAERPIAIDLSAF